MAAQGKASKPFYKDRKDTLEDAGISEKQLRTWREAGLFKSDLGIGTRHFTARDIAKLKFLKRLIDDLELKVPVVQRLLQSMDKTDLLNWAAPWRCSYIDVTAGTLVTPKSALRQILSAMLQASTGSEISNLSQFDDFLRGLLLIRFKVMANHHSSPALYKAAREEFLSQIPHIDRLARVYDAVAFMEAAEESTPLDLSPYLQEDSGLSPDYMRNLAKESKKMFDEWNINPFPF